MPSTDSKRPTYTVPAIAADMRQASFLGNPALDNVVSCIIAMGAEMWSTRRRMKVLEALLAQKGVSADMIERYVPSEAEKATWEQDRQRFIDLTFGPLGDEGTRNIATDFVTP